MLTTNLLPPEEKKTIRREETRRTVVLFGVAMSLVFLTGAVLLLPSFLPFLFERREFERALKLEESASSDFEVARLSPKIDSARDTIKLIENLESGAEELVLLPAEILDYAGPGIELTGLNVKRSGEVRIGGIARSRGGLLAFEKALRDSGRFREISSPLANIVRETDVSFNISAQIK